MLDSIVVTIFSWEHIWWKSQPSWKSVQTTAKKLSKFIKKNHTYRWYYDTQSCKISCSNLTSFVRYKNNKFQANKLSKWFVINLLFLYLTNEVEFGQDILKDCVSSYHLYVWFFCEFRWLFCRGLHGFSWKFSFHQICSQG